MKAGRPYRQLQRRAATEVTRERILDVAEDLFLGSWYDQVTMRDVAAAAAVSPQTVVNHFGTKANLLAVLADRVGGRIDDRRDQTVPGDIAGGVAMLVDEYEQIGDGIVRMLALEGRVAELSDLLAHGRGVHRSWVQRVFAASLPDRGADRDRRTAILVAATDVYTWKLLRRDQGLSRRATVRAMQEIVTALTSESEREP